MAPRLARRDGRLDAAGVGLPAAGEASAMVTPEISVVTVATAGRDVSVVMASGGRSAPPPGVALIAAAKIDPSRAIRRA